MEVPHLVVLSETNLSAMPASETITVDLHRLWLQFFGKECSFGTLVALYSHTLREKAQASRKVSG